MAASRSDLNRPVRHESSTTEVEVQEPSVKSVVPRIESQPRLGTVVISEDAVQSWDETTTMIGLRPGTDSQGRQRRKRPRPRN